MSKSTFFLIVSTDLSGEIPSSIMAAFAAAENVRRTLVSSSIVLILIFKCKLYSCCLSCYFLQSLFYKITKFIARLSVLGHSIVFSLYFHLQLEKRQKLCVLVEEAKEGEGQKDVEMIDPDGPSK